LKIDRDSALDTECGSGLGGQRSAGPDFDDDQDDVGKP
jgi:hypothetical protein